MGQWFIRWTCLVFVFLFYLVQIQETHASARFIHIPSPKPPLIQNDLPSPSTTKLTTKTSLPISKTSLITSALSKGVSSFDIPYIERSFDEELILSVRLGNYILLDGIIAYQHQTGVMLPLGEMMEALEFAIDVSSRTGKADGWFLRENRTFFLNAATGELSILGKKQSYQKQLVEIHENEIYVDSTLFSKWFPVETKVSLSTSRVLVTSREPLPLEERIKREQAHGRLGKGGRKEEITLPKLSTPYGLISSPIIDVSLNSDYQSTDGTEKLNNSYNVFMASDLLYMTGNVFVSGRDDDIIDNIRLTLERKDSESNLTVLGLSEITIGDVFTPSVPLMVNSQSGRGIQISNFPMDTIREFDRITLRDNLPIGWEVELYRNDSLLDARTSPDADGRYEFLDVALLFGPNVIKLVFYGPQGQRREEIQTYNIGSGSIPRGTHNFSLAVNQQNKDIFQTINNSGQTSTDIDDGELRGVLEYQTGLSKRISAKMDIASASIDGKRETLIRAGFLTSFFGASFTEINAISILGGGNAAEISTQFKFLGISSNVSHEHFFKGFNSEEIQEGSDPVRDRTAVSFNGSFSSLAFLPRLSYGLNLDYERKQSGLAVIDFQNRLSGNIKGVSFTNNITGSKNLNTATNNDIELSGDLLLNTSDIFGIKTLNLRGGLDYELKPTTEFTSLSFTSDYDLNDKTGLRFNINKQLTGNKTTSYGAGLNHDFDRYALSLNSSYSDTGDFSVTTALNFSLNPKSSGQGSIFSREKNADSGDLIAQIFLDNNSNNIFDDGDEPIQDANLNIGNRPSEEQSNENGIIHIGGLSAHQNINVSLNSVSLPDPYWRSAVEGNNISPRPGITSKLYFPVNKTGEIDGVVYMNTAESSKEISNVHLELLDHEGNIIQTSKTAFDGFYLFLNVIPGEYMLRIAPSQLNKFGINKSDVMPIKIGKEGSILNGIDFHLINPNLE